MTVVRKKRSRSERYLRIVQVTLTSLIILLLALIVLRALGSLYTAKIHSAPAVPSGSGITIQTQYSITNSGPVPLSPLIITLKMVTPDGTQLTTNSSNYVFIQPFSTSNGTLMFNMSLLPGAAQKLEALFKNNQQPIIIAQVSSSMLGLVHFQLSLYLPVLSAPISAYSIQRG